MNISGTTVILVNGKPTRVCSRLFNKAFRQACNRDLTSRPESFVVLTESGDRIIPSKGEGWLFVAKNIRAGKKVVAKVA